MLKQFFITSFRFIIRNKVVSVINTVGLTFGITFAILISLYVKKEISVDKTFRYRDRIYRLEYQYPERNPGAVMVSAVGPDLNSSLAGIEDVVRVQFGADITLKSDNVTYLNIPRACIADSGFFNFFEQSWIYGTPEDALNRPLSIVLNDELARKIFGDINPVGKNLYYPSGDFALTVTGVFKKINDSHLQYDALISLVSRNLESSTILHTYSTQQWLTYFLVAKGTDPKILEDQIHNQLKVLIPSLRDGTGNSDFKVILNPLEKIYFNRKTRDLAALHGNRSLVMIFIAAAILIIIIACINFINLSTARAIARAREVGLRKILGSDRGTLIRQFLAESLIISTLSTIFAVIIAEALLPYFNRFSGSNLDISLTDNPYSIPALLLIIIATGVLAGLYPAYYISAYEPVAVVKGEIARGRKSLMFRRGLIIFQFFISVILLSGSLLTSKQLKYTREKDLGFEKEGILSVELPGVVLRNRDNVKARLLECPEIKNVSFSYTIPGSHLNYEGFTINDKEVNPQVFSIDPDYINTFGLELKSGRFFDWNISTDSVSNCLINETLAKQTGLEDPVNGTFLHDSWYITVFPVKNFHIIGVVKDFHFKSFRTAIEPLILAWNPGWFNYMNIKITDGGISAAMEKVRKIMDDYVPGMPVEYQFIEDSFDRMYKSDERMGKIFLWFTLLAIIISILGIIGMAIFAAEQRIREVAIRKTYGATVISVVSRFAGEFVLLALIANVIGSPFFIWLGKKWLEEFVYKTNIDSSVIIATALITMLVATLTVIAVTWRTSVSNPADSLRHE
jgi:putative ABC transport system permease protein